ncbi:MAG: tryptophan synthase subunit alpha [Planctomycetota bacterium]|nr:tryptophan synthase subunit alpha [Planctomycetota bacterium]MDA1177197.1 tryptophan synthase subunit alpha [Planctomycetota bacterium]
MSSVDDLFADLKRSGRKALIPFVTAGDPDLAFTADVIRTLLKHGGSLCEIGIPYSDPIADGPIIQASYTRALQAGIRLRDIWHMLGQLSSTGVGPCVTMVSYAIVYRYGLETYVAEAKQRGVAGMIVPDLPVDESEKFSQLCRQHDLSLIQLVTPTTPRDRAKRIAANSSGFLYYVSVAGITGERRDLPTNLVENVAWLKSQTELPICIGFGISQPEQARLAASVADGVIVGSAFVRRMAEATTPLSRAKTLDELAKFARELAESLQ